MPLNEASSDLHPFVSHTWNTVRAECLQDCIHCYITRLGDRKIRFDNGELKTDLGWGNFIFVGSSCDLFAEAIPQEWIETTLFMCKLKPSNKYLWKSKNPKRFMDFLDFVSPSNTVFCTTIESDMDHIKGPPAIDERFNWICKVKNSGFPVAISIDPIMDFDENRLLEMINDIGPQWVSIGADSQGHGLQEPTPEKIQVFLSELGRNPKIELVVKSNLGRLM